MKAFSALIDRLAFTPSRNTKLRLLDGYLKSAPDPDRGWAVAALTGALDFPNVKAGTIRGLIETRTDPALFRWSYDYVGDLAETAALLWPDADAAETPRLSEVADGLGAVSRAEAPEMLAGMLDRLDADGRWALLKLVTGGFRIGVSARLVKVALAAHGGVEPAEVEEVWHALDPPYADLLAWLDGAGARPDAAAAGAFRPVMLAHPLEEADIARLNPADYLAEWKWDGVRVQLTGRPDGPPRLYTRTGDEIGASFPEISAAFDATVDGELLVAKPDGFDPAGPFAEGDFAELQKRLNRKTVTQKQIAAAPAFLRLYDLLFEDGVDLRGRPLSERRGRLERWFARVRPERCDLSALIAFETLDDLAALRAQARDAGQEGLMLKRADAAYVAGRPKGLWWKWKREPLCVDAVLMYAQRGHGGRSSFYSDFTFGCWDEDGTLAPIGKAYFGFTDGEMKALDKWVRGHTVARYGPVREVSPELVLEVAFDAAQASPRHRSGVALRFPRLRAIRWDKPAEEADRLAAVRRLAGI